MPRRPARVVIEHGLRPPLESIPLLHLPRTSEGLRPSICHSRHPSKAHARIPSPSNRSFSFRFLSLLALGIETVNGRRCNRLRMASSTLRMNGLWLPMTRSLNCGVC
jgi:hypothetical protein